MFNESSVTESHSKSRLESAAFYIFLATVVLAPLVFWPSTFVPLNLVKTAVIVLGTLISAILCGIIALKERKMALPPKSISSISVLIAVAMTLSSLLSINAMKSLFGQGFEVGTAGFILCLFVSALVAFTLVARRAERAVVIYVAVVVAFLILYLFHALRFFLGSGFASFSVFNSLTATPLGNWPNMGIYSLVVALVSLIAVSVLPLSFRMHLVYWILIIFGALAAIFINPPLIWQPAILVFLGLAVYMYFFKAKTDTLGRSKIRHLAWLPIIACLVSAFFVSPIGSRVAGSTAAKLYGSYSELALPWQMTIDVTAGAIKSLPLLGVGPNHFVQAFLAFKPAGLNQTGAWGVEFGTGFGLLPTFVAEQGVIGTILWILFFVFFGMAGVRALGRRLPVDPSARFVMISSYASAAFLWLSALIYVPSHVLIFLAFVFTGIFFGGSLAFGSLEGNGLASRQGSFSYRALPLLVTVLIIIAAAWGLSYVRKTAAVAFFASGVGELSPAGNADLADSFFKKALAIDSSDVYWQARSEAALSKATSLAQSVTAATPATTSQALYGEVTSEIDQAREFSKNAIASDQTNYFNYVSLARAAEMGANFRLPQNYEDAVNAYLQAINRNPANPSLYLNLARLQANQSKLDDALQTLGAALNVKNNYLDAIFILSQVYAAKGNLPQAITAAQVALGLNPENPLLHFQLGLLQYNSKDYANAAASLAEAVRLQGDYANARYFLGLADARVGKTADAITQFTELAKTNPDNQEVSLILVNLRAGKPIFADAAPPVTADPEKRPMLPIKEKQK
ncbi:MAG: hypothetical protein QOG91_224 [Candidatus Parcubacteria bacterium]|jgi:tetratricopeptide (TPR) repeat protein|nr:hypothetical protein [Candidatus Parcubacteria bacterium]